MKKSEEPDIESILNDILIRITVIENILLKKQIVSDKDLKDETSLIVGEVSKLAANKLMEVLTKSDQLDIDTIINQLSDKIKNGSN